MSKISLIIRREWNERVRKRSFLVTTILTPLLFVAMIGGAAYMAVPRPGKVKIVEVIDASGIVADKLTGTSSIQYRTSVRTLDEINAHHGDAWGVLVIGADLLTNPGNVQLYTFSPSTVETETSISHAVARIVEAEKLKNYDIGDLQQILREVHTDVEVKAYKVDERSGEEKASSSVLSMTMASVLGLLMYMFVLLYGAQVMNGVIEEKNSKVLEVIVSSVRPFQLMLGKIVGIACVALTQFFIWVAAIAVFGTLIIRHIVPPDTLAALQQGVSAGMGGEGIAQAMRPETFAALSNLMDVGYLGKMLIAFLIYFAGGYLLYAAAFAAVGSAVDNVQDSQQFQLPVTLPLMLGMLGMLNAMQDPSGQLAFWLSIIPFTSPMVMVARIPYGVPGWELALSMVLLAATFILVVWLAGKIYRVGIFMYGKKPSLRELAKWTTYKS